MEVESYWAGLFAKLAEKRNIEDLILNAGASGGGAPVAAAAPAAGGGAAAAAPPPEEKKVIKEFHYLKQIGYYNNCPRISGFKYYD